MTTDTNTKFAEYASNTLTDRSRDIPERLKEQTSIGKEIHRFFKDKYVLELACGTGYWTQYLQGSARQVLATDINEEMLEIASKRMSDPSMQFLIADAYNPPVGVPEFSGVMAHCWFSHIPKKKIKGFLKDLHARLTPGASIMFMDAVYRKELGGTLVTKKDSEDTWKRRKLASGEEYEILKNYYTEAELQALFAPYAHNLSVSYLTHFWLVEYTLSK